MNDEAIELETYESDDLETQNQPMTEEIEVEE